jgi:hypothetical protein
VDGFDFDSYPTDGVNEQHLKNKGGNVRLRWDLPGVTLHSITGYEKLEFYSRADVDGGYGAVYAPPYGPGFIPFVVETADVIPNHKQISQELRAESNTKARCSGSPACSTSRKTSRSTALRSTRWHRATRRCRTTQRRRRTPGRGPPSAR